MPSNVKGEIHKLADQNDIKALNEIIEYFYGKLNDTTGTKFGETYYSWIQSLRKAQNALITNQSLEEALKHIEMSRNAQQDENRVVYSNRLLEDIAILLKKGEQD